MVSCGKSSVTVMCLVSVSPHSCHLMPVETNFSTSSNAHYEIKQELCVCWRRFSQGSYGSWLSLSFDDHMLEEMRVLYGNLSLTVYARFLFKRFVLCIPSI